MATDKTPESSPFVRRTHTAKSITVREARLLSYLISKVYNSPAPKGSSIDRKALSAAFSTVATFVEGAIAEAEGQRAAFAKAAKGGDEGAAKQLKQVNAALAEMEKQKKNGQWDRITQLGREVKPAKVKADGEKPAKAVKKAAAKGGGRPEGDGKGATRKPSKAERKVQRAQAAQPAQPAQAAQAAQAAAATTEAPPAVV